MDQETVPQSGADSQEESVQVSIPDSPFDSTETIEQAPAVEESTTQESEEAPQTEAEPEESAEFELADWDGRVENLPDNIRPYVEPTHKEIIRGGQAKYREIAERRKELDAQIAKYTEALEKLQSGQGKPPEDLPPPEPNPETATNKDWLEYSRNLAKHEARQQIKPVLEKLGGFEKEQVSQQHIQQLQAVEQRGNAIEQRNDYTPAVGQRMLELVEADPGLANLRFSDTGMESLFKIAKTDVGASEAARATAKRNVTAGKRSVTRPKGTKTGTPANKYEGTFDDIAKQVFEEAGVDYNSRDSLDWED